VLRWNKSDTELSMVDRETITIRILTHRLGLGRETAPIKDEGPDVIGLLYPPYL